ncbi:12589_t:CDS:2, partial [Funneliformis mosseae]
INTISWLNMRNRESFWFLKNKNFGIMSSRNNNSSITSSNTLTTLNNISIKQDESETIEELSSEDKSNLIKEIIELQEGLKALVERVESVKNDHDQKQSGNQILQTYINNLMSSKVLASANIIQNIGFELVQKVPDILISYNPVD